MIITTRRSADVPGATVAVVVVETIKTAGEEQSGKDKPQAFSGPRSVAWR